MSQSSKDEKEIARQYLKDHQISKLFKRITILLLVNRPENVQRFIVEQLQKDKDLCTEPVLNEDEMKTLFAMLSDPITMNKVSGNKVNGALKAMGIAGRVRDDQHFNAEEFEQAMSKIFEHY